MRACPCHECELVRHETAAELAFLRARIEQLELERQRLLRDLDDGPRGTCESCELRPAGHRVYGFAVCGECVA